VETLLTILVLVLLSAASGWLKKRSENQENETQPPPQVTGRTNPPPRQVPSGGGTPQPRPATRSWEEELRRLLEGESPPAPPPPPQAPPSLPSRPQPPPVIAVPPVSRPRQPIPASPVLQPIEHLAPVSVDLRETSTARMQTQRLQGRAAAELKRAEALVARRLSQSRVMHRGGSTAEIAAARGWFKSPEAARQAVVVSVILGPPVGLQPGGLPQSGV
jgi:hypothetical protein